MMISKTIAEALLLSALAVLIAGCQTVPNNTVSNPTPNPSQAAAPIPSQLPDLTQDWNTYTNVKYGYSFKYPQTYVVEERAPGFVVITSPTEHVAQAGISIDTRLMGLYANYETAQQAKLSSMNINETKTIALWEIIEGAEKDGMLKGVGFRYGLAHFQTGAIVAETMAASPYKKSFDQILSTFEINEPTGADKITIKLAVKNSADDCDSTTYIEREIPETQAVLTDTIKLLLVEKLKSEEKSKGLINLFDPASYNNGKSSTRLTLKSAVIKNGVAILTFDDPDFFTSGGSCLTGSMASQIANTAKQFPTVKSVKLLPPELFQP